MVYYRDSSEVALEKSQCSKRESSQSPHNDTLWGTKE